MRVYISGAITGRKNAKDNFEEAEQRLTEAGYEVVNPFKVCSMLPGSFSHEDYMQVCFRLIDVCQCVYMLPDWASSKGALAEYFYAKAIGKKIEMLE